MKAINLINRVLGVILIFGSISCCKREEVITGIPKDDITSSVFMGFIFVCLNILVINMLLKRKRT